MPSGPTSAAIERNSMDAGLGREGWRPWCTTGERIQWRSGLLLLTHLVGGGPIRGAPLRTLIEEPGRRITCALFPGTWDMVRGTKEIRALSSVG